MFKCRVDIVGPGRTTRGQGGRVIRSKKSSNDSFFFEMRLITNINGIQIEMEIDSGSDFSLISEDTARLIWEHRLPQLSSPAV